MLLSASGQVNSLPWSCIGCQHCQLMWQGTTPATSVLFAMQAKEMFAIFWKKLGLKAFWWHFVKPELHHKEHLLKTGFAVVTIQFESSSSAPTQPGLLWMGSATNTGKKEDKCMQVQWHFRAAIVSEGVKINCSSARAVRSCWLWIFGRKELWNKSKNSVLRDFYFSSNQFPDEGTQSWSWTQKSI